MIDPTALFKALSDETRLRAVVLMARADELCVCELCHALDVSQPMMSRHLAMLRKLGLVDDRRQGQWIFYRVADNLPMWARKVIKASAKGLSKSRYGRDRDRLKVMRNRPDRQAAE